MWGRLMRGCLIKGAGLVPSITCTFNVGPADAEKTAFFLSAFNIYGAANLAYDFFANG